VPNKIDEVPQNEIEKLVLEQMAKLIEEDNSL